MAYIFKSIAATQFLSNMLFIYFFVKCNILLLNVQVSNGYFIATFSENVKNHKYFTNRKRWSNFERIFDPQGSTRVSYAKWKISNFRHFWWPSWIFAENEKV